MEVVYKSGRKHLNADCFSRNPSLPEDASLDVTGTDILNWSNIVEEQRQDLRHQKVFVKADAYDRIISNNGILYKRRFHPESVKFVLVLSRSYYDEVLHAFHDQSPAGHLGFARTLQRVRKRFFVGQK